MIVSLIGIWKPPRRFFLRGLLLNLLQLGELPLLLLNKAATSVIICIGNFQPVEVILKHCWKTFLEGTSPGETNIFQKKNFTWRDKHFGSWLRAELLVAP